ncbi:MAG: RsmG family class I SAM-dependent methyltransferase [Actinomycetota bacterium]|nr:RsmG family class I SAM-dependent methyltransferase [Actinomycetota bacterium]
MGNETAGIAVRAARWAGTDLSDEQVAQLRVYHDWILAEATRAGGLGPNEERRLWSRHIADSLTFGFPFDGGGSCIDIGSGAGLPGIPLAIMRPDLDFELVDRSGRRCDLLRRAIMVIGLDNCTVSQQDLATIDQVYGYLVSRAAVPVEQMMIHVKRVLAPNGVGVLGLSRSNQPEAIPRGPAGLTTSIVTVPVEILDTAAYLLRIEAT